MLINKSRLLCLIILPMLFTTASYATINKGERIIVLPTCLYKKLHGRSTVLTATKKFVLMSTDTKNIGQLAAAKHHQTNTCGGFIDVTNDWKAYQGKNHASNNSAATYLRTYVRTPKAPTSSKKIHYKIKYKHQVKQVMSQLVPERMWTNLETLSSFPDRSIKYNDQGVSHGLEAAMWVKHQAEAIAKDNARTDVSISLIDTDPSIERFPPVYIPLSRNGDSKKPLQPSIVVKIGTSTQPGIVVGAHMDTLLTNNENDVMPGADDDGTGTVALLELMRTVLSSGLTFKKPIYLIWYAGEEEGLLGSQSVVADFQKHQIPIAAVMQFDMIGYDFNNEHAMALAKDDYVNHDLTDYLAKLIKVYVKRPFEYTQSCFACSDHAVWNKSGVAVAFPWEGKMEVDLEKFEILSDHTNPFIHSSRDTMDKLSLEHMTDYAKLAVAFIVELAKPRV